MRLFIAVNFDEQINENMMNVQERLKRFGKCSFTRPENLHLTLVFLGETAETRVKAVKRVMDEITVPSLHLTFDRVGRFSRYDGDIWWIGLAYNSALITLHKELIDRLQSAGFNLGKRRYSPHITLARRSILSVMPDKERLLGCPFTTTADAVSLMLSEQTKGKLTYTELYAVYAK